MKIKAQNTLIIILLIFAACTEKNPEELAYFFRDDSGNIPSTTDYEKGTVTDIDGNTYKTMKFGEKWWMTENLKVKKYSDGSYLSRGNSWDINFDEDAKYYFIYDNDDNNLDEFGCLYTWKAAMGNGHSSNIIPSGIRGICPEGWHLPSDEEWIQMEMELGLSYTEATNTNRSWYANEDFANSFKNPKIFNAQKGGYRSSYNFSGLYEDGYYWSSTQEEFSTYAYYRQVNSFNDYVERQTASPINGYSVRCVKDDPGNPSTLGSGNYFSYKGNTYEITNCLLEYYDSFQDGMSYDTDITLFTDGVSFTNFLDFSFTGTGKVVVFRYLISEDKYMEDGSYYFNADTNYYYYNYFNEGVIASIYDGVEKIDEGFYFSSGEMEKNIFGSDIQITFSGEDEYGYSFEGSYFGPYDDIDYTLKSTKRKILELGTPKMP